MAALKQNRDKWKHSDDQDEIMYFERICTTKFIKWHENHQKFDLLQ